MDLARAAQLRCDVSFSADIHPYVCLATQKHIASSICQRAFLRDLSDLGLQLGVWADISSVGFDWEIHATKTGHDMNDDLFYH
jgi:hypothetical protein